MEQSKAIGKSSQVKHTLDLLWAKYISMLRSCGPDGATAPCVWDPGGFHTHFQCVSLCGRRNASLPCVRSAEEAAAIAAAAVGTEWAWVGLYQLTEDRHGIDQGWERVAQCTGVDNHTERAGRR